MARVWVRDPVPHAEGLQERGGEMGGYFKSQAVGARKQAKTSRKAAWFHVAIAAVMAFVSVITFANGSWFGLVYLGLTAVWLLLALLSRRTAELNEEAAEAYERIAAL